MWNIEHNYYYLELYNKTLTEKKRNWLPLSTKVKFFRITDYFYICCFKVTMYLSCFISQTEQVFTFSAMFSPHTYIVILSNQIFYTLHTISQSEKCCFYSPSLKPIEKGIIQFHLAAVVKVSVLLHPDLGKSQSEQVKFFPIIGTDRKPVTCTNITVVHHGGFVKTKQ